MLLTTKNVLFIFFVFQGVAGDVLWDEYLDGVYDLLGSYHFQKNRLLYNVKDLKDWGYGSEEQGLVINETNLNEFMKLMKDYDDLSYNIIGDDFSDEIEDLNYVIDATIGNQLEVAINGTLRASIEGHIFRASDFGKDTLKLISSVDSVDVFVVDSLFLDANVVLQLAKTHTINVYATNWYVQHYSFNILDFVNSVNVVVGYGKNFMREKEMIESQIGEKKCSNLIMTFTATKTSERCEIYSPQGPVMADAVADRIVPIEDLDSPIIPDCAMHNVTLTGKNTRQRAETFERYKMFLIKNYLKNGFLARKVSDFLANIDRDMDTKDAYIKDPYRPLLDEFLYIEDNEFDKNVDLLFLYRVLLKKSADVTRDALSKNAILPNQKVLFHIYSAVLGKICNLERDAEIYLVTNLRDYAEIITGNIAKVEESGKEVIIDEATSTYSSELDAQIGQVKDLISTQIQPVIESDVQNLNGDVSDLLSNIDDLVSQVEQDEQKLLSLKKKLKDSIKARTVLGVLKGIADVAASFFPPAEIVGSLIGDAEDAFVPDVSVDDVAGKYDIPKLTNDSTKILDGLAKANFTCQMGQDVTRLALDIFNKLNDLGNDIYSQYKNYEDKLEIISEQIVQLEEDVDKLHEMKTQICQTLGPVLSKMTEDITNLQNALVGQSETSLEIEKWNIQSALGKIQNYLDTYFGQFEATSSTSEEIRQLSSAVSTMISMYDIIQNYNEHKKWGQVMDQMLSADFDNVDIPGDLGMDFDKLELYINSNMVLLEFKHFADAVKQYSFPLADVYFKQFDIPSAMQMSFSSVEVVTDRVLGVIDNVKTRLGEDIDAILGVDSQKFSNIYFGNSGARPAFSVWTDLDFRDTLTSLLKGEVVTLTSDINQSPSANAIKFNVVELKFRSLNPKFTQKDVDKLLDNFMVKMVHSGNSYYKCDNKTFLVGSHSLEIIYSFKRDASGGRPAIANEVYEKLDKGDSILSPYTTWQVQLQKDTTDFDSLQALIGNVDLELFGRAQYYGQDEKLCNNYNVEKYYTQINGDVSKTQSRRRQKRAVDGQSTLAANAKGDIIVF